MFSLLKLYRTVFAFCLLTSFPFSANLFAQGVGINTISPDLSSALDIHSNNKGILIPRVALTSLNDGVTIVHPANSLLVWNTNAALESGTGYYFNRGSANAPQWTAFQADPNAIWSDKIAFRASGVSEADRKIAPNSDSNILFSTEEYDLGNNYSANVFTAPVSGIYHFDVSIKFTNALQGEILYNMFKSPMYIKQIRNGVTTNIAQAYTNQGHNSTDFYNEISADLKLEQGDQIFLTNGYYPNPNYFSGDFLYLYTDNVATHFNGRLVSVVSQ
ncbi:complement C1q domain-containing protein [Dyadobacter sp. CY323]|uniref:complement C1q domain-containing protein n=1 Tax=Dyadobacter sp. CY323 TaxID=2907302 RepID=UPI001F2AA7C0|nr:complement C1q domain-containing protein [Dyadobacter sp. CY323]